MRDVILSQWRHLQLGTGLKYTIIHLMGNNEQGIKGILIEPVFDKSRFKIVPGFVGKDEHKTSSWNMIAIGKLVCR